MAGAPAISVVVPTRGRPEAVSRCLAALSAQTVPCEVVLVDDSPEGDLDVAALSSRGAGRTQDATQVRVLRTGAAGPAAARNAGAREAAGEIVCFTDDDCAPVRVWLELLTAAARDTGAAAGETVNANPGDPFAAASQLLTSALQRASLDEARGALGFAPTSNLAVSAEVIRELPFDETFPFAAGEDREWCARLAARGIALRHEPRAIVHHHQRLGARGFWRQQVRYGRGAAGLRGSGAHLASPGQRVAMAREALRAGPRVAALAAIAQGAIAWGYATERLTRRR